MVDYDLLEKELARIKVLMDGGDCPMVFVEEKLRAVARLLDVEFIREKEYGFLNNLGGSSNGIMNAEDVEYNFRYIERVLKQRKNGFFSI
ncbi:MAG: hypothetical protein HQL21_05840 [Candidatus Omnitrophica bacterium]|nr:hypothetical protein [Candidatus Omnitrophota bacterium]